MHKNIFITAACTAFILCSCSSVKNNAEKRDEVVLPQRQEIEAEMRAAASAEDYVLQAGDLIEIKVFQEPSLDRSVRLTSNNIIALPLIGGAEILGSTVSTAEQTLTNAFKTYLKDPYINIFVKEYGNASVYVIGQVHKPQSVKIPPERNLTLLEAISAVGGFTDVAAASKIRILRIENGVERTMFVDITKAIKQGDKAADILLMPGDVVFVPQSLF